MRRDRIPQPWITALGDVSLEPSHAGREERACHLADGCERYSIVHNGPCAIDHQPDKPCRDQQEAKATREKLHGRIPLQTEGRYLVPFVAMAKAIPGDLSQVRSCLLPTFSDTRALR